jgi:hypothetical protein
MVTTMRMVQHDSSGDDAGDDGSAMTMRMLAKTIQMARARARA